ncbi:hypothetical protein RB195_000667 [Necator americanus]|uniref:DUF3715 domain-containing protein n=1 Tax=Necator americanus TaxID=51031 RepID=A0ABR1DBI3_NECAM
MNFVIPKKKRAVEKSIIDVSTLEPKATIEDAPRDSEKFNTVKNVILNGVSDRQVHHFVHVEKVQVIKNPFLEYKYDQFKANLRGSGQSDAESFEFLLIGFDSDDLTYIADNGYSVGTSFYGDLGSTTRGVYLYRYVDLVTPSLLYKDEVMRIMVFRTLRGKSYGVGLGSTELEPTLECCSHVAAPDNTPLLRKSRQQLHRQAAVYHYEYRKDMSVAEVPSGVLPYAVVDLRFNISDKNQHSSIFPTIGYVHEALYFYPVYEGNLKILSANFPRALLSTVFEDSNKPHGLDGSLVFTKLLQWIDAFDIRGVNQLMAHDTWGLIARQREICVKNVNDRSEKWKFRYVSHFVWTCNDPRFTSLVNGMRVEQCAAVAYSIDATTYVAFPSGQFSNILGLPWLQIPSLHVLVVHNNPLFYADPNDVTSFNDETATIAKTPLGTAILDGDDAVLCRFFDHQGALNFPSGQATESTEEVPRSHPGVRYSNGESPYQQSPSQNSEALPGDSDGEQAVPLPPVDLPSSAGKSCLRSKPPQVFVEQPPLIGKSVPPPAPGTGRNLASFGPIPSRKTRIRWAENVVDNENKCGKKFSNDRDEAVKAGWHGRTPPKESTAKKSSPSSADSLPSNSPAFGVRPGPSTGGTKYKDLFQGVFSGNVDSDVVNNVLPDAPTPAASETSKTFSSAKRTGNSKNCIITSLPLPLFGRVADSNRESNNSSAVASASVQQPEEVSAICDMEIESSSDGTPTPPQTKTSPDGVADVVDFIDDQDEDYDALFHCESMDSQSCSSDTPASPTPCAKNFEPSTATVPVPVDVESSQNEAVDNEVTSLLKELVPSRAETALVPNAPASPDRSSELDGPASPPPSSPPPTSVSEMPENVLRLLELLRSNEASSQNRDTDLRKQTPIVTTSNTSSESYGRQRKSRFDQPPPELAGCAGYVPKPVPPASIGFVGTVPALGSSIKDTDLRSQPPASLAFSIKKQPVAPALNPPAPLVFGDDVDDDDNVDCDERQKTSERRDRDDRIKKWGRPVGGPSVDVSTPILSQTPNLGKEKPSDNSKLFHILAGARMLQSQRDKQSVEHVSSSQPSTSGSSFPAVTRSEGAASSKETPTVTVGAGNSTSHSIVANHSNEASEPHAAPTKTSLLGNAFEQPQNVAPKVCKDTPASPEAPASPDPEGPASPDAPASPDPEEREANGSIPLNQKAQSEIPLDCWQPTEDKRPEPVRILTVRTPKKPKRPKDIDAISCKGNEDQVMHSWIKALEQKSETTTALKRERSTGSSRSVDDEEEEGEILSDGSDDPKDTPKPITVIGATSNNFHSSFTRKSSKADISTSSTHTTSGPPAHSNIGILPQQNMAAGRGILNEQAFGTPPWHTTLPACTSLPGSAFQHSLPQQETPGITVIVPDFMMFNRAAMTRMDPAGFESFCVRLKVIQTKENRIVSLQMHERLLHYVREMMQSLAGSEAGNAFQMYYSVILKYKELGIVHFMERHACDNGDVCAAQTINCFTALRKQYYPSTVLIYMSNMSPSSSTGAALSSLGVRVMPPNTVLRTFGLESLRHSIQS